MKTNFRRNSILAFMFLALLGIGLALRPAVVRAQDSGASSTPEAQSPEKNQQEADENDAYRKSPTVIALGSKLGLNPRDSATAFEVINFLLLAVGAGYVLAKSLPRMIRHRNTAIQKHLLDAKTATEEARSRLARVEERLARLDQEIGSMRAHAEEDAVREEQRIRAAVESEKRKILAAAEQEIAAAAMNARKQLQQHAADLAIEQAARKLVVSAETDRLLIQSFASKLAEPKKGQN